MLSIPMVAKAADEVVPVSIDDMISSVYKDLRSDKLLNFALGSPSFELLPAAS